MSFVYLILLSQAIKQPLLIPIVARKLWHNGISDAMTDGRRKLNKINLCLILGTTRLLCHFYSKLKRFPASGGAILFFSALTSQFLQWYSIIPIPACSCCIVYCLLQQTTLGTRYCRFSRLLADMRLSFTKSLSVPLPAWSFTHYLILSQDICKYDICQSLGLILPFPGSLRTW